MPRLKFKPAARKDLSSILAFIARDNPARAFSFVDDIQQACRVWAESPMAGRARPDIRAGIRSFTHGKYVIFYQPEDDGISVVRVLHGSRDHRSLFK